MRRLVDQRAAGGGDGLVDGIGELEAAILDMHARRTVRNIAPVDIGDAGHRPSPPSPSLPLKGGGGTKLRSPPPLRGRAREGGIPKDHHETFTSRAWRSRQPGPASLTCGGVTSGLCPRKPREGR